MEKNKYLQILLWAYENSESGFTQQQLFDKFELNNGEKQQWYQTMFMNSGHGNVVLIEHFYTRKETGYWILSPKGMSEAVDYLNLKEAQKSSQRAEKIALTAIKLSIAAICVSVFFSIIEILVSICIN